MAMRRKMYLTLPKSSFSNAYDGIYTWYATFFLFNFETVAGSKFCSVPEAGSQRANSHLVAGLMF